MATDLKLENKVQEKKKGSICWPCAWKEKRAISYHMVTPVQHKYYMPIGRTICGAGTSEARKMEPVWVLYYKLRTGLLQQKCTCEACLHKGSKKCLKNVSIDDLSWNWQNAFFLDSSLR